jgi:hypothetical protein
MLGQLHRRIAQYSLKSQQSKRKYQPEIAKVRCTYKPLSLRATVSASMRRPPTALHHGRAKENEPHHVEQHHDKE